jgi:superfamily II RNA helicase
MVKKHVLLRLNITCSHHTSSTSPCRVQVVRMKGRVACEVSTCECLIATEAIFRGVFTGLAPEEAVALLCALVNQHRIKKEDISSGARSLPLNNES